MVEDLERRLDIRRNTPLDSQQRQTLKLQLLQVILLVEPDAPAVHLSAQPGTSVKSPNHQPPHVSEAMRGIADSAPRSQLHQHTHWWYPVDSTQLLELLQKPLDQGGLGWGWVAGSTPLRIWRLVKACTTTTAPTSVFQEELADVYYRQRRYQLGLARPCQALSCHAMTPHAMQCAMPCAIALCHASRAQADMPCHARWLHACAHASCCRHSPAQAARRGPVPQHAHPGPSAHHWLCALHS